MKALLVIDMQKGSFIPYSIRHDTLGTVDRINLLAAAFREKNYPVIFIQHDGTHEGCFLPDSEDWELLPELVFLPNDISLNKTANDSFYNSTLLETLLSHGISEVFITGCATDFCVDSTLKSALTKDFKVTVVEDGHTTGSSPFADAQTLINHYNWVWDDMSPTKFKIRVMKAGDVEV